MGLPKQKFIELPLLFEIEQMGGSARPDTAFYDRVASHFPGLGVEARRLVNASDRSNKWENRVMWARNHLAGNRELDRSVRGVWRITERGRERLNREWPQWDASRVEYSRRLYTDMPRSSRGRARPGRDRIMPPQPPVAPPGPTGTPVETAPPRSTIVEALRQRLEALNSDQFQDFCRAYLEKKGLRNVRVTGQTRDGGIDGDGEVPFLGVKAAFQAKKWAQGQTVGAGPIRELLGSITNRGADRGIFITTASFSAGGREEAELSQGRIILIDGQHLAQDCIDMQLGIKPVTTEAAIDEEFFNAL